MEEGKKEGWREWEGAGVGGKCRRVRKRWWRDGWRKREIRNEENRVGGR